MGTKRHQQALALLSAILIVNIAAADNKVPGEYKCKSELCSRAAVLSHVTTFRSQLSRESVTLTVVAPFSLERLQPLEIQCQLRKDSEFIVFAGSIYLPVYEGKVYSEFAPSLNGSDVSQTIDSVKAFHDKLSSAGCIVDLALWREELPDISGEWYTYPNNAMRNKALALAETEVVALIDADFVMGPTNFGTQFQKGFPVYENAMRSLSEKTVLVMPAFDCPMDFNKDDEVRKAVIAAAESKEALVASDGISQFQSDYHKNTNYDKWKTSNKIYYIPFEGVGQKYYYGYEPYILALKKALPCYDERFRGYYFNKTSYLYYIYRLGFKFEVQPDAFVVHYPHAKMNSSSRWTGQKFHLKLKLIQEMAVEISNMEYKPWVPDGSCPTGFFD